MTETKTPVRRNARTLPAKTRGIAAMAPAAAKKKALSKPAAAAAKIAAPAAKTPAHKPANKPPAMPAANPPTAAMSPAMPMASPASTAPQAAVVTAAPPGLAAAVADPLKVRAQPKGDSFKLRMLVDQVVKATGAKKKGVKEVVEATLSRLGEALARGDELNLPGFGKVRIVKTDAREGSAIMTLKLRQAAAGSGQKDLADRKDDD